MKVDLDYRPHGEYGSKIGNRIRHVLRADIAANPGKYSALDLVEKYGCAEGTVRKARREVKGLLRDDRAVSEENNRKKARECFEKFPELTVREVSLRTGVSKWVCLMVRREVVGFGRVSKWTEFEDDVIKKFYRPKGTRFVVEMLGRTRGSVIGRYRRLVEAGVIVDRKDIAEQRLKLPQYHFVVP